MNKFYYEKKIEGNRRLRVRVRSGLFYLILDSPTSHRPRLPLYPWCNHPRIDYFKDKSASTVAQFVYQVVCRHGCMKLQINDQGRKFVNEVNKDLHNIVGTVQRITSAYHSQSNGLCERQNRTIKDSLVKFPDGNPCDWPNIIEGVLFQHRVSKHISTKFSTFFLMFDREHIWRIGVKYGLVGIEQYEREHPFDKETFDAVLTTTISMRANIHQTASENICSDKKNKSVITIDTIKCLIRLKWVKKIEETEKDGQKT